ncbi:CinA family protein [Rhodovibrionaceae bacterium A322]
MFPAFLMTQAEDLLQSCRSQGLTLATVESCTGGLVSALLTAIAGSSDVVDRGFVTYTNEAKQELVGVPPHLIAQKGAVSSEVALAMAEGGLAHSRADLSVSLTGIAGPGGATATKPVGLVYLGIARKGRASQSHRCVFSGDRQAVRQAALEKALCLLEEAARAPGKAGDN